jgi:hypothetical protein
LIFRVMAQVSLQSAALIPMRDVYAKLTGTM